MKLLKNLFSNDSIIANGQKAIDSVVLTKEESVEYFLKFIEATLPMNMSRRIITFFVCAMWFLTGVIYLASIYAWPKLVPLVHDYALFYVMPPFTVITGFYFWRRYERAKK